MLVDKITGDQAEQIDTLFEIAAILVINRMPQHNDVAAILRVLEHTESDLLHIVGAAAGLGALSRRRESWH